MLYILICIFLMANNFGHIFYGLFAIKILSFWETPFVKFLIGFFVFLMDVFAELFIYSRCHFYLRRVVYRYFLQVFRFILFSTEYFIEQTSVTLIKSNLYFFHLIELAFDVKSVKRLPSLKS